MKNVNLQSITQASKQLESETFQKFKKYLEIDLKDQELDDLSNFVTHLAECKTPAPKYEHFYMGYTIPQIGKEFDLIRLDGKSVVNIELKSKSTDEKIQRQLIRNKYYLSSLDRTAFLYTFVSQTNTLYKLLDDNSVVKADFNDLVEKLQRQNVDFSESLDNLFDPSIFLVSPFNSTQKFLDDQYFLTKQQEEIKSCIDGCLKRT